MQSSATDRSLNRAVGTRGYLVGGGTFRGQLDRNISKHSPLNGLALLLPLPRFSYLPTALVPRFSGSAEELVAKAASNHGTKGRQNLFRSGRATSVKTKYSYCVFDLLTTLVNLIHCFSLNPSNPTLEY